MVTCGSCGIPLGGESVSSADEVYCCAGCAVGGPCICTYEQDLGRYPPVQYARPVSLSELLDRYESGIQTQVQRPGVSASAEKNEDLT